MSASEPEFDLVKEFWAIAKANYEQSYGWSVFSECYCDDGVKDIYGDCTSRAELFEAMATAADIWTDKWNDAQQYLREAGY